MNSANKQGDDISVIEENKKDLATALVWADKYSFNEGVCNHFSLMLPGQFNDKFVINPHGILWSDITPQSLSVCDINCDDADLPADIEPTAYYIHKYIHAKLPHAKAVLHTHMPYATLLACIDAPRLEMISQNAIRFYRRVTYINSYTGLVLNSEDAINIAKGIEGGGIVLLANHGVISIVETIAQAFDDLYYFERACQIQFMAQATGKKLNIINDDVVEHTAAQFANTRPQQAEAFFKELRKIF